MYTLSEFRKNLRKAFNDAEQGHQVIIERYGQFYQLVNLVDLPLGGSAFESNPEGIDPIKPLAPKFTPKKEVIKTPKQAEKAIEKLNDPPTGYISKSYSARLKK